MVPVVADVLPLSTLYNRRTVHTVHLVIVVALPYACSLYLKSCWHEKTSAPKQFLVTKIGEVVGLISPGLLGTNNSYIHKLFV
jgi:hypothetical protein